MCAVHQLRVRNASVPPQGSGFLQGAEPGTASRGASGSGLTPGVLLLSTGRISQNTHLQNSLSSDVFQKLLNVNKQGFKSL